MLGTMDKVDAARARMSEGQANQLSVRLELQADFLAGVWAQLMRNKKVCWSRVTLRKRLTQRVRSAMIGYREKAKGFVVPDFFYARQF